ncbi:MAG TPA: lipopolysaccharide biosynthesis protein [Solirubrobacteraceae bacterium]|jgi:PST family polysaccharide transporter|nr:lipopolysaccharide biosynthesis protein [Solirubrobacteraceae bacterium]
MATAESAPGLGVRTLRGVLWNYGSYIGGRTLVLISTAVLARLLSPREFGLVAIAITAMVLMDAVGDLGVTQALVISKADELYERAETALVASIALGALLSAITAALGPLAASFFSDDRLTAIVPVLGARFFLRSLGATHFALAQRQINFRARAGAEFADVSVRGVTGIVLALSGFGVWSLVVGYLAGTAARVITLWVLITWRPRLSPSMHHLRSMLRFGGTVSAVDVIADIGANVDNAFVGRLLGSAALGLYSIAYRLPELLILNLATVAGEVLFPAFATADRQDLRRGFVVSLRYTLIVGVGLSVGLAVLAEPFLLALFGPKWGGSVTAMRVLSVFALAVTVGIPAGTVYKAIGRADIVLKMAIPRLILLVPLLALFVDQGIVAAALCQAGVAVAGDLFGIALASRLLSVPARVLWLNARPAVLAALGAGVGMWIVQHTIHTAWLALVVGVSEGVTVYLGLIFVLAPEVLDTLIGALRRTATPPTAVS